MWVVYIIQSATGRLYTGITVEIVRRVRQHNGDLAGGAKATRAGRPWELVYAEIHPDRSAASKREAFIKSFTKRAKNQLIDAPSKESLGDLN